MARSGIYSDAPSNTRGSRVLPEVELICGQNIFIDNEGDRRRALSGSHSRPEVTVTGIVIGGLNSDAYMGLAYFPKDFQVSTTRHFTDG